MEETLKEMEKDVKNFKIFKTCIESAIKCYLNEFADTSIDEIPRFYRKLNVFISNQPTLKII